MIFFPQIKINQRRTDQLLERLWYWNIYQPWVLQQNLRSQPPTCGRSNDLKSKYVFRYFFKVHEMLLFHSKWGNLTETSYTFKIKYPTMVVIPGKGFSRSWKKEKKTKQVGEYRCISSDFLHLGRPVDVWETDLIFLSCLLLICCDRRPAQQLHLWMVNNHCGSLSHFSDKTIGRPGPLNISDQPKTATSAIKLQHKHKAHKGSSLKT